MRQLTFPFILLILIILTTSGWTQEIIFEDNFIDNKNSWAEDNNQYAEYKIENGKYIVRYKKKKYSINLTLSIPFDESMDFTIESIMTKKSGNNDAVYGLQWGRDSENNHYLFGINGNGGFLINKFVNGKFYQLISRKTTEYINKGKSTNKLTIMKSRNTLKFFANDHLLAEMPYEKLFGYMIGFNVVNKQKIEFDNLIVSVSPHEPLKQTSSLEVETEDKPISKPCDIDLNIPETNMDGKNTIMIIIGIEEYKYAPNADFASNDAQSFYQYSQKVFRVPEPNIYNCINDEATSGEFSKIFSKNGWIARRIKKNITDVIIFYSGHGAPDINSKKGYLIPYDIDPNYAHDTAFSLDDMYSLLSKLDAKSVTVFLDACFSGESRSHEMLVSGIRPISISIENPILTTENIVVISASTGAQYGSAYPEKQHGLFTYFLLKGLKGEAKGNDKNITIGELFNFIQNNVSEIAGYLDKEQTPTFIGRNKNRVIVTF